MLTLKISIKFVKKKEKENSIGLKKVYGFENVYSREIYFVPILFSRKTLNLVYLKVFFS